MQTLTVRLSLDCNGPTSLSSSFSGRTVTTTAQQLVRKCAVEKKIFQELLEMKKYQIRAGRSNEAVLVKRLIKNYNKVRLLQSSSPP